jgi:DMSO/TMAO reductase YedYZ molybdopterin-dependent catalytic subunit
MIKFRIIPVIIILLFCSLAGCVADQYPVTNDDNSNNEVDGFTMATPNGGELKSAEEGPARSALGEPSIDLSTFKLMITGLVDSAYSLSWEEIQEMDPYYTDTMIMYCVEGWEVWGAWKGILVKDLLDRAHVQEDGKYIMFRSRDGYRTALPVAYLVKYNAILAYQVNNAPLQKHDGFPLRLIAFGKYGYKWAKWVYVMDVMNESQLGYWEELGFSDRADVSLDRRSFYEGDSAKPLSY